MCRFNKRCHRTGHLVRKGCWLILSADEYEDECCLECSPKHRHDFVHVQINDSRSATHSANYTDEFADAVLRACRERCRLKDPRGGHVAYCGELYDDAPSLAVKP